MYPATGYGGAAGGPVPPPKRRSPWTWVAIALAGLVVLGLAAFTTARLLGNEGSEVQVPALVGKTQADANRLLTEAGLVGDFDTAPSTAQQKGKVIVSDPAAGFALKEGETVKVTVGGGPATIGVPDVVGLSYEDAAVQLKAAKLVPVRQDTNSDKAAGTVLATSPKPGAQATENQRVTVQVSNGRSKLPDVVGKSDEEATAILNQAGWTSIERQVVAPPDDFDAGTVFRTDPTSGSFVAKDATITLFIAKARPTPAPTTPTPGPTSPTTTPTGSPTSTAGG
jgi:beta-lactam-binding protein with PASTA domain